MIDKNQIYVCVDIEADGCVPGIYSMLSIAAVATDAKKDISEFYRTIQPCKDAKQDPDTIEWWSKHPEAWEEVTTNPQPPEKVMKEFVAWVKSLGAEPVFVAHPVALDYTFVGWYLQKFAGEDPFRNEKNFSRTLDLRSFISGKYNITLTQAHRKNLPEALTKGMPKHTHQAIDDARGYTIILRNVLATKTI